MVVGRIRMRMPRTPDSAEFVLITARIPPEMDRRLERCLARLNESQPGMEAKLSTIVRMALARGLAELEEELFGRGKKAWGSHRRRLRATDKCHMLPSRWHELRAHSRKPIEHIRESHWRIDEVLGLLAQQLDHRVRVEIEQVAEKLVGRLRFDTSRKRSEMLQVRSDDDLCTRFERGAWTLSAQHAYDVKNKTIYRGDGERSSGTDVNRLVTNTVVGGGG
jgi:hypothetical protein